MTRKQSVHLRAISGIYISQGLTYHEIREELRGSGQPVPSLGWFTHHFGKRKNAPATGAARGFAGDTSTDNKQYTQEVAS